MHGPNEQSGTYLNSLRLKQGLEQIRYAQGEKSGDDGAGGV